MQNGPDKLLKVGGESIEKYLQILASRVQEAKELHSEVTQALFEIEKSKGDSELLQGWRDYLRRNMKELVLPAMQMQGAVRAGLATREHIAEFLVALNTHMEQIRRGGFSISQPTSSENVILFPDEKSA